MSKSTLSKPLSVYEIRIKGHLDPHRIRVCEGLRVKHLPNGETTLIGPVPDQAGLYGILNRLRDLGVPLVSVNQRVDEKELL